MISSRRTFLLFALFAVAFGENDVGSGDESTKLEERTIVHEYILNDAFDNALPSIKKFITKHGFDPMDIPDVEVPLSPMPGLLKTKVHLHHGHMQQLSSIYRTGDIIMQYTMEKVSFYMNVGFKTLDLSHEYSLRYMLYTRRGDCYGRYHNVTASMLVDIDLSSHQIDLKFFKFQDVKSFKLRLEGHLTDGLLNIVSDVLTKMFRNQMLRVIEAKCYDEIDKQVKEINAVSSNVLVIEKFMQRLFDWLEIDRP